MQLITSREPAKKTPAPPFTIMAKPMGSQCNLVCGYCYYRDNRCAGSSRMSDETLEIFIRQYIEASGGSVIYFTWHGGEPALAGLDFFRLAADLQKHYLPKGQTCRNNLQTNGLLIDEEWCDFLASEQFDVGISLDGTQPLHDAQRKTPGGNGTYQSAADAVKRLKNYGIKPDLLCTVTSKTAEKPLEVYRALRDFDTGWIQFIPIVQRSPGGKPVFESVSGEAYGRFLCDIFDEWVISDLGRTEVQLFAETLRILAGGSAGLCWMAPVCGRALVVEQDGRVYSCDHYVDLEYRLGSIKDTHLKELVNLPRQLIFGKNKRENLPKRCLDCAWLAFCGGGCPKDRFAAPESGELPINHLCAGLKRFFEYTRPVMEFILILQKNRFTPEAIMQELRKQLKEIWKNIGRNDPCPCGSGQKAKQCCWHKRL